MTYHFIGIGGIGMSALARILLQKGKKISGTDLAHSALIDELQSKGAKIGPQNSDELVSQATHVIYTSGLSKDHIEYNCALKRNIPLLHRSDLLAELMQEKLPLLVAGAHGKTTTSSLLTHVLHACGANPAFAVGGIVNNLQTNGEWGEGAYFVAEADESDGTFLKYPGFGAIITNIDDDHLSFWKNQQAICEGFKQFAQNIQSSSHLFWCGDDPLLRALNIKGISYGFTEGLDLQITHFDQQEWHTLFSCQFQGKEYRDICIPLIGKYNALNAAAVFGLSLSLNLPEHSIRNALATFIGVGRRMEKVGEKQEIQFYDDYGHHPTEIVATLTALKKAAGNRRLVVAFQSHLFSRTRDSLPSFLSAFGSADLLIITDIYPARELPIPGITGEWLTQKIQEASSKQVIFISRDSLSPSLAKLLQPNDLLLTLGAGDITNIGQEVMQFL